MLAGILEAGEIIYIPRKWPHHALALTDAVSITLNFCLTKAQSSAYAPCAHTASLLIRYCYVICRECSSINGYNSTRGCRNCVATGVWFRSGVFKFLMPYMRSRTRVQLWMGRTLRANGVWAGDRDPDHGSDPLWQDIHKEDDSLHRRATKLGLARKFLQ